MGLVTFVIAGLCGWAGLWGLTMVMTMDVTKMAGTKAKLMCGRPE